MAFSSINVWTPGDLLTATQINKIDSNLVDSFDKRPEYANTIDSDNTFTGINTFDAGDLNINSELNVNGTFNIEEDPSYTTPPLKTIFINPVKIKYWYTTADTTSNSYILNYTASAKQAIINKSIDSEQASIAYPGVPYLKINYWNNAYLKSKTHQYILDLSEVGEGNTITDITIHYQPFGYVDEPGSSAERITFAVFKSKEIADLVNISDAPQILHSAPVVDTADYTTSTKYDLSIGTIEDTKSNLCSYYLEVLTGAYAGSGSSGSILILGASVTYTKLILQ